MICGPKPRCNEIDTRLLGPSFALGATRSSLISRMQRSRPEVLRTPSAMEQYNSQWTVYGTATEPVEGGVTP